MPHMSQIKAKWGLYESSTQWGFLEACFRPIKFNGNVTRFPEISKVTILFISNDKTPNSKSWVYQNSRQYGKSPSLRGSFIDLGDRPHPGPLDLRGLGLARGSSEEAISASELRFVRSSRWGCRRRSSFCTSSGTREDSLKVNIEA